MRAFFSEPRKIDLGCTVISALLSATVLNNVLNKSGKIKHERYK